jgi:superfamily II DNA or RNA helicase
MIESAYVAIFVTFVFLICISCNEIFCPGNCNASAMSLFDLQQRLAALDQERAQIIREMDRLRTFVAAENIHDQGMSPAEKIVLFLEMFGARRSVYPKYWHNGKTGKKGYSPVCENEWQRGVCEKPRVKCTECKHQRFLPLDVQAVEQHLRGEHTIGVYALREDNGCIFLAADFDGAGWRADVTAYRDAARRCGTHAWVERSRSGNGAHAWIFFTEPVPAILARQLGSVLLALASSTHPTLGLGAYDRLFPNQDVLPDGGFGNLIALPLAREPRAKGNCVFLDEELEPEKDQWALLLRAKKSRVTYEKLHELLTSITPINVPAKAIPNATSAAKDELLVLKNEEAVLDISRPRITPGMLSGIVTVRLDSCVHVPRPLPPAVLAALRRLATFSNPVYHEKLRLRFSTHETPRFIFAGEWHAERLVLPRGTLDAVITILETAGADVVLQDARPEGTRVAWTFSGQLRLNQTQAVKVMMKHEHGILCAQPGSGKTVMGCALAARHRMATLVIVHRSVLLDQWRQEAMRFLGLKRREIGMWRGSTRRLTKRFDIAMMPSATRIENFEALFSDYGLIIIDECHHVPAASFEALMKACPTKRIVGLTATPVRKDRLEKLLYFQCGPIRHVMNETHDTGMMPERVVFVRESNFQMPVCSKKPEHVPLLHEIWDSLAKDEKRIGKIVSDIHESMGEGRCPLVLSDRKAHLQAIAAALVADGTATEWARESSVGASAETASTEVAVIYRLEGTVGKREREKIRAAMNAHFTSNRPFVLLATASLVGEGFDLPRLDTLFLAMPLSFKGRLIQYAGRLHRAHESKRDVRIYDYVDDLPLTRAMFRRRSVAYQEMGYKMELEIPAESRTDEGQMGLPRLGS